jgi:type VI secretion system VasD/TssJ family lipoprotein
MPMRTPLRLALLLIAATGCLPFHHDPSVTVNVEGDSRMNIVNDRPNAAVVRVYELTARANFDRASRAALWRDDAAALGDELVAKRELTLLPDDHESLKIMLKKTTKFVAVAADLYDPDGEGWRVVYATQSAKKPIRLHLAERQLSSR